MIPASPGKWHRRRDPKISNRLRAVVTAFRTDQAASVGPHEEPVRKYILLQWSVAPFTPFGGKENESKSGAIPRVSY